MRPQRFYIVRVGGHWEVTSSQRSLPASRHPDRHSAQIAARALADTQWREHHVASEVMLSEDDGAWHRVASFGSILDS